MSQAITKKELEVMEATLKHGLKICCRLKKKLGPAASGPSSRKGFKEALATAKRNRRNHFLRKAS